MTIEMRFDIEQGDFRLDVDLSLPSTGVSSLFGPSGCGKTTLIRAIAGLEHHPGGFLKVDNSIWQDAQTFLPVHRRPLGYVFQESSLFGHLSVKGNLEYGVKRVPIADRHISLDDAIGLLEIGNLLPRKPHTLSGGERRRVAIARALAVSPKLLLLDEPLAGLDASRKQEIIPYIESLHRKLDIPIIHVSHVPEEVARLSDHLVLMKDGRVTAAGDVHEVFTRLDLQLAQGDDAAAIIEAKVASHDEHYQLTHMDFAGGRITMSRMPLLPGQTARLRLAARDISLTLEQQQDTSILNILPVTVDAITPHGEAQVTVRLLAGGVPLLAHITRKSAEDLGLASGKPIFAQIKSVALLT
jgi:molybdate transport system ATP-binding protein